ncbi:DNA-directed RNA polymerase subunit beta [Paenibacillus lemnae]|uniref:DNA-directed RNA polymerase subunit beta n=1 Tax=Paenibacillus lemnae TaxID=1330551 RepID=A0A848MD41_PAELE|nr:DNA-directed RNA polymerase subunit beta [Paenibacillus lemnae]
MSEASEPKAHKTPGWKIALRIIVPLMLLLALGGGMVAGYVILGDGEMSDVFQWSTWKHVYDLVFSP